MYYGRPMRPHYPMPQQLTPQEFIWRRSWPYLITFIIAILMAILTLLIFALEVAQLGANSSTFYTTGTTGAGIWCAVFFGTATVLIFIFRK
ncbi:unnamed protein product [Didymodactylos carnosus]|uniref:Uncharacterized protein n=1 Tax=Didymodactylos carnosus TaxID=1234261 RepID=A0A8S2WXU5_9BILA|nr:unnamed protein product [Didymodactylos carnosus]CAF4464831.1 unnamed protein product [Didymodactylos carnosus]